MYLLKASNWLVNLVSRRAPGHDRHGRMPRIVRRNALIVQVAWTVVAFVQVIPSAR